MAQFYCRKLFDLEEIKPFNRSGPDLESKDGKLKFEVKYRKMEVEMDDDRILNRTPPGMPINLESIDYVLYVYLDDNLLPKFIFKIKSEDIDYTGTDKRVSFKRAFKEEKKYEIIFKS